VRYLLLCGLLVLVGCSGAETKPKIRYVSYKIFFKSAPGVVAGRKAMEGKTDVLGPGTRVERVDPGESSKIILVQFQQPESVSNDNAMAEIKKLPEVASVEVY
jgi:hypothetical protein